MDETDETDETFEFRQNVEMSVKQILRKNHIIQSNTGDATPSSNDKKHTRGKLKRTKKIYQPSSISNSAISCIQSESSSNNLLYKNSKNKPSYSSSTRKVAANHITTTSTNTPSTQEHSANRQIDWILDNEEKIANKRTQEEKEQSNDHQHDDASTTTAAVQLVAKMPEVVLYKNKSTKAKIASPNEANLPSLNSAWLRDQFRCDKRFISCNFEPENSTNKCSLNTRTMDMFSHPLKDQIMYHVMSIRKTFRQMSAQAQSQMIEQVKNSALEKLKFRTMLSQESRTSSSRTEGDFDDHDDADSPTLTNLQETKIDGTQKNCETSSIIQHMGVAPNDGTIERMQSSCSDIPTNNSSSPSDHGKKGQSEPMECWPLVVFEALEEIEDNMKNESFVYIHRMQTVNFNCWVISFHDCKFCEKERYMLHDDDVLTIVSDFGINLNFFQTDKEVALVYCENITEDIECSINVHELSCHFLYAKISYRTLNDNITLDVPIYEVMALLGLQNKYKSLNVKFWKSNSNQELWKNFVSNIDYTELIHNEPQGQHNSTVTSYWIEQNVEQTPLSLQRMMTCPEFRNALSQANSILHSLASDDYHDSMMSALKERNAELEPLQYQLATEHYKAEIIRNLIDSQQQFSTGYKDTINLQTSQEDSSGDKHCVDVEIHVRKVNDNMTLNTNIKVETPIEVPVYQIFSKLPIMPEPLKEDIVSDPITSIMIPCEKPLDRPCLHNNGEWTVPQVLLVDYSSDDEETAIKNTDESLIMPTFCENSNNMKNTRKKYPAHKINRNRSYQLHKPRISPNSLMANETRTHEKISFHSEETCTTSFSSKGRGLEDFIPIIEHEYSEKDGASPNDPLVFRIHMDAYKLQKIDGVSLANYQDHRKQGSQNSSVPIKRCQDTVDNTKPLTKINGSKVIFTNTCIDSKAKDCSGMQCDSIIDHNKYIFDGSFKLKSYQIGDCSTFEANKPQVVPLDAAQQIQALSYMMDENIFEVKPQVEFIDDLLDSKCHMLQTIDVERKTFIDSILNAEQQEQALDQVLEIWLQNKMQRDYITAENNLLEESSKPSLKWKVINLTLQATRQANFEMLETFLDNHGVDVNTADEFGNTLLLLAAQQGNKKLCKFLLRRGAHINAQNSTGNTLLHFLHKFGHLDLADYMRQKGADDSFVNYEGLTCYEMTNDQLLYF